MKLRLIDERIFFRIDKKSIYPKIIKRLSVKPYSRLYHVLIDIAGFGIPRFDKRMDFRKDYYCQPIFFAIGFA
jgi:hypothetical protein